MKNKKIKFLILIVSILFFAVGCTPTTVYVTDSGADFSFNIKLDSSYYGYYFTVVPWEFSADLENNGFVAVGSSSSNRDGYGEFDDWSNCRSVNEVLNAYGGMNDSFKVFIKLWPDAVPVTQSGSFQLHFYNNSTCSSTLVKRKESNKITLVVSETSTQTQSIQTGVESELLNKIGGISEYCNYDETLHYNELPSSANMFSKIAYSQVNCATTKYSSSYDNGISFINWVFEKNGASPRLPSTYNEVITWAGNKIFTADAKGTNIQAGDLVILGSDSTSPIEIVVQVNSNRIKTVGYKTSGNNKVIYETSHNDILNGKRIIKMNGVSY